MDIIIKKENNITHGYMTYDQHTVIAGRSEVCVHLIDCACRSIEQEV